MKAGFTLLKIYLTVANLLLITAYCPVKVGWLVTYKWMAGDLCCRFFQYLWLFSSHFSSFVVACIAVDRLRTVTRLASIAQGHSRRLVLTGADNILTPVKVTEFTLVKFYKKHVFLWRLENFSVDAMISSHLCCMDALGEGVHLFLERFFPSRGDLNVSHRVHYE